MPRFPSDVQPKNVLSMVAWTMGQHVSLLLEGSQRGKRSRCVLPGMSLSRVHETKCLFNLPATAEVRSCPRRKVDRRADSPVMRTILHFIEVLQQQHVHSILLFYCFLFLAHP